MLPEVGSLEGTGGCNRAGGLHKGYDAWAACCCPNLCFQFVEYGVLLVVESVKDAGGKRGERAVHTHGVSSILFGSFPLPLICFLWEETFYWLKPPCYGI